MKEDVTFTRFHDAMKSTYNGNGFTYEGLRALYEYLIELEESTAEELELDPIAFYSTYTQYENINEFWNDYDKETFPDKGSIFDHTAYIEVDQDSFIIEQF